MFAQFGAPQQVWLSQLVSPICRKLGYSLSGSTANRHWWQYGFFSLSLLSCSGLGAGLLFFALVSLPELEGAFRLDASCGGSSGGGVRTSLSTDAARREFGLLVVFVSVGTVESAMGEDAVDAADMGCEIG